MKQIALAATLMTALATHADVLYSNGPVVDHAGLSVVPATVATIGLGVQSFYDNRIADDFTVAGADWKVTGLEFFAFYQTMTTFSFTSATWSIVAGDVNSGTVVASGTGGVTSGGLLGYRVVSPNLASTDNPIWGVKADIPDVTLSAGTYWLTWSLASTGPQYNGPWQPTTSDLRVGNMMQSYPGSGGFITPHDYQTGLTYEAPFVIEGSTAAVPEPGQALLLTAGLTWLAARRRQCRPKRAVVASFTAVARRCR